jgi:hypothetical protein
MKEKKDIFKLIDELKVKFKGNVSTEWSGKKKTSVLLVKIDASKNEDLKKELEVLKTENSVLWDKLDIYTNKKGIILFELKPYDFGYLELVDFMKKNKINTRCNVYNKREQIEHIYRSTKWIYYRFKEAK